VSLLQAEMSWRWMARRRAVGKLALERRPIAQWNPNLCMIGRDALAIVARAAFQVPKYTHAEQHNI